VKALLGFRAKGRKVRKGGDARYQLREGAAQYKALFRVEKSIVPEPFGLKPIIILKDVEIWKIK